MFWVTQNLWSYSPKTLPCRVGSLSEVGLPMFQSDDMLHKLIIFGNYGSKDRTKLDIEVCSYRKRMARNTILPSFTWNFYEIEPYYACYTWIFLHIVKTLFQFMHSFQEFLECWLTAKYHGRAHALVGLFPCCLYLWGRNKYYSFLLLSGKTFSNKIN